eukprot:gene10459-biopygen2991
MNLSCWVAVIKMSSFVETICVTCIHTLAAHPLLGIDLPGVSSWEWMDGNACLLVLSDRPPFQEGPFRMPDRGTKIVLIELRVEVHHLCEAKMVYLKSQFDRSCLGAI